MGASKEITEALLSVRAGIKKLTHNAENPHGEYNYVSIDKYYEQVARIATEKGLAWRTTEKEYNLLEGQGARKDRTYVKVKFQFDLMAGSSSYEDYMNITILSPIDGPQTAGQVYSYADKVFMRVAFCVPSGEKDADATKQEPVVVRSEGPDPILSGTVQVQGTSNVVPLHDKQTGEVMPEIVSRTSKEGLPIIDTRKLSDNAGVSMIEGIIQRWIPDITTTAKLTDWHAENLAAFEKVKTLDPAAHQRIKDMFNKRFTELKPKGK